MLAKSLREGVIQCTACNRYCAIKEGDAGYCGVRANKNGKLDLIVNNKPVAIWIDPIEKKPLFHFLPGSRSYSIGTLGCNFACSFCQNWDISQAPHEARQKNPKEWRSYFQHLVDKCDKYEPKRIVDEARRNGCKSISFTYNEPTIFAEYAVDVMEEAKKYGIRGVFVTNGYESKECWDFIRDYIDAANIDLKAYNDNFYKKLCNVPDWEKIKDSIKYAKKIGIWVEVTTLIIPGWNSKLSELKEAAEFLASVDRDMPWHLTAFHPDYKLRDVERTEPEILIRAREVGKAAGIKHVYCGNLMRSYSDYETTVCPVCRFELIKRYGMVVTEYNVMDSCCPKCGEKILGVFE